EAEQARAVTAQTRAQIPLLQTAAAQAEHSLAVLTRRPPAALRNNLSARALASSTMPSQPAPPAELVLAFPADTLRQRPDVRAAQARVIAASARVRQALADRLPSFRLSGSLGLNAVSLGALTNGSSVLASILAGVSAPLLDGGAGRARVQVQQAALEGAAASYDAAILAALKDVEDSLAALRNDRERLQALRVAADAAQTAAQLARQRFGSGLVDFQVVLDTQRTVLNAQDGVAGSGGDVNADHVRLYKALGGGWEAGSLIDAPAAGAHKP
ncbi:TolC family protein, partial [Roseateles sp.]|uniref:TolC family protein n=1 Tax=Roseateles sp. TaxID=1971397 RepID=UPI0032672E9D